MPYFCTLKARPAPAPLPTPREIFTQLDRYVIGQDKAKRAVSIAAHNHLKRVAQRRAGQKTLLKKSNVLLIGPTGSGKTHIARQLAGILDVPFVVADATEPELIASVIVHEATHARLRRHGIGYEEPIRARVEAACIRRQIAFTRRLPHGDHARAAAERNLASLGRSA